MKWRQIVCNSGYYLCDTVFMTGVRGLRWAGNIASFSAGLLSATSFALEESVTAGFVVQANATGTGGLNFTSTGIDTNRYLEYVFMNPFTTQGYFEGSLTDYVEPYYFQLAALALFSTGITLKSISAFLAIFFRGLQESDYYYRNDAIDLSLPKYYEFIYKVTEAACEAVTLSMLTNTVILAVLRYSPLLQNDYAITYPFSSNRSIETDSYAGPVEPLNYSFNQDNGFAYSIRQNGFSLSTILNTSINFTVSALYGGGGSLHCHEPNGAAITPTAVLAVASYGLSLFCHRKAREKRNQRLMESSAYDEGEGRDLNLPCC